ncbi:MAG: hypothetical protein FJX35_03465 [Alphaproteobacteria bacterium]|nr:hypothetical protein [Alphaproteobacteria bacterium]
MTPSVYISVEESARELAAKLLLSAILAERGFTVVLGQQWLLNDNLFHLPAGFVLFKGNNAIQHHHMRVAKRAGHMVGSIEEEALMVTDENELRRLYDTGVAGTCDLFLAHGTALRDLLAKWFPGIATKTEVTGNPRIDFLRPEFLHDTKAEGARIRREFGRFVLFNLNYATINSAHGDVLSYFDVCVNAKIYKPDDSTDERLFRELVQWEYDNLGAMTAAIDWLERNATGVGIVVRPHPSERFEVWQRALSGRPRVRLVRGGSHLPWTMASEIMVHTSCTTGAEAFLAGHQAVSLCPSDNALTFGFLSNLVNPTFRTPEEACRYVMARLDGGGASARHDDTYTQVLDHHLAARTGKLAAERIADAIEQHLPAPSPAAAAAWSVGKGFRTQRALHIGQAHKMVETQDDIQASLASLQQTLRRFDGLSVTPLGRSLFCVTRS